MRKGSGQNGNGSAKGVLVVVVIVLLSTGLRPSALPQLVAHQDKLHHLIGFFAFAWALRGAFPGVGFAAFLAAGAVGAVAIEVVQAFLPLRTASLLDVLASIAGMLLGWGGQALRMRATPPVQ